jgi:hypothetical protein
MRDVREGIPRRDKLQTRWGQLKTERASWWAHWQDISTYLLPRNGRFFVQDRNKGWRRHNAIYDNTATRALRVQSAGMMAGATSPARPWVELAAIDPELNKRHAVQMWLQEVTKIILATFARSNTYRVLHQMYEELGAFGTACAIVLPDDTEDIHLYPVTVGEFALAQDFKGNVCTCYREFDKTVGELVKEFGYDQCSISVRNMYDQGSLDSWVTVIHAIEPREDRDPSKRDSLNMPWRSVYFEVGSDPGQYLRESGFESFPVLSPRWSVAGGDVYGGSPGQEALGDIKGLQHKHLRLAQVIDYQTKPPLQVPSTMKNRDVETLPGGVTFVDAAGGGNGIRPAWEVNLNPSHLLMNIQDDRQRINATFFADMFLMLANDAGTGRMTATEVAERHEEKMLQLGPVLERLHDELLEPLIDLTFMYLLKAGKLPPIPEELSGADIKPEFISVLSQAQRMIGVNSIDRFMVGLGNVAQFKPDALDKFDVDAWVDETAKMLGVPSSMIIPNDVVDGLREQRNKALAAQQQVAATEQMTKSAANLAAVPTTDRNALTDVMSGLTGYTTPGPEAM